MKKLLVLEISNYERGGAHRYVQELIDSTDKNKWGVDYRPLGKPTRKNPYRMPTDDFNVNEVVNRYDAVMLNLTAPSDYNRWSDPNAVPFEYDFIERLKTVRPSLPLITKVGGLEFELVDPWSSQLVGMIDAFVTPRPTQFNLYNAKVGLGLLRTQPSARWNVIPFGLDDNLVDLHLAHHYNLIYEKYYNPKWLFPSRFVTVKRPTIMHDIANQYAETYGRDRVPTVVYAGQGGGMSTKNLTDEFNRTAHYPMQILGGYDPEQAKDIYENAKFVFDFQYPIKKIDTAEGRIIVPYCGGMQYTQIDAVRMGILPVCSHDTIPENVAGGYTVLMTPPELNQFPYRKNTHSVELQPLIDKLHDITYDEYVHRLYNCWQFFDAAGMRKSSQITAWNNLLNSLV